MRPCCGWPSTVPFDLGGRPHHGSPWITTPAASPRHSDPPQHPPPAPQPPDSCAASTAAPAAPGAPATAPADSRAHPEPASGAVPARCEEGPRSTRRGRPPCSPRPQNPVDALPLASIGPAPTHGGPHALTKTRSAGPPRPPAPSGGLPSRGSLAAAHAGARTSPARPCTPSPPTDGNLPLQCRRERRQYARRPR